MKDLVEMAEKDPKKEKILNKVVSNFSCKTNEDIELFLKDSTRGFKSKAIMLEKKNITRTYFIIDENMFLENH